ncbi:hypothetical protein MYX76_16250 [Desulfobacterota bacterium AH_259_B03_O07]|nr:hypothetical protein [Desulfobacterota bacterium AH_259_B03_O07]
MNENLVLDEFNINNLFEELNLIGATSFKILNEGFRLRLLEEAETYSYKAEEEIVGSGDKIVRQQMSSFEDFPKGSKFIKLKNCFQALLDDCLSNLKSYPFDTKLIFNSMSLQKYEKGSIGITPHRDGFRYKNIICNFNISGSGRFFICSDRSRKDSKEIDFPPGSILFMRAAGFLGSDFRPFHYVKDIQDTRYVFGLRQESATTK